MRETRCRVLSRGLGRVRQALGLVLGVSLAGCVVPQAADKPERFEGALAAIASGEAPAQHALLVYQSGVLLLEQYWAGDDGPRGDRVFGPDELHDLRSCTKSVVGLLVGQAIAAGDLPAVDAPAHTLFPEQADGLSAAHRQIALADVLDMTDGLEWQQDNTKPKMLSNEFWTFRSPDAVGYVWSRPVARPAGEAFNYNSGATELLGGALQRALGRDVEAIAADRLFAPLGIDHWEWRRQADGTPVAAWGLRLAPRDMLKIGRLVLQRGKWEGCQIVPAEWIEATSERRGGTRGYGHQWWLDRYTVAGETLHAVAAGGFGGQYIHVFPELDAVVVMTAGHYDDLGAAGPGSFALLERWVLPGLIDAKR